MQHRRQDINSKRQQNGLQAHENAVAAVGELTPGCEIFGLTKGQFSLIDLIEAMLAQTGTADVTVATWTAAKADIERAYRLLSSQRITGLRFLVDFSFPRRQPQYCAALRERFGDGAVRVTKTHAKFVLIRNEQWQLVVRTSMNLNANARMETYEISDDAAMADALEGFVAEVYAAQADGEGFGRRPVDNVNEFEGFGVDPDAEYGRYVGRFGSDLDDPMKPGLEVT